MPLSPSPSPLYRLFYISVPLIVLLESSAFLLRDLLSPLAVTAFIRCLDITVLMALMHKIPGVPGMTGISYSQISRGIKTGIIWSALFGLTVAAAGFVFLWNNINPLSLIASHIPFKGYELVLFFITGGLIAPIAEEIIFRGILYSFLRQFGCPMAVILSTVIFAGFHVNGSGIPLFQIVGGVVFALAFERSQSLAAPIIIHSLGNLAIFTISVISYPA
ncbi:MAG: CPBP family intramembrane metalloprotease [Desulfobacteraceae bacterium]|nr:CPBP family intramembrane metalloprotease [Desulfobacteraceae bacterium]